MDKDALLSGIETDLKSKSELLEKSNLEIEGLRESLELVREEVSRNNSAHEEHVKDLEEQMELRCKYSLTQRNNVAPIRILLLYRQYIS